MDQNFVFDEHGAPCLANFTLLHHLDHSAFDPLVFWSLSNTVPTEVQHSQLCVFSECLRNLIS